MTPPALTQSGVGPLPQRIQRAPYPHTGRWLSDHPRVRRVLGASPFNGLARIDAVHISAARLGLGVIVCIPVRNEAERLGRCLAALEVSIARLGEPSGVCVIVNNSSDSSAKIACAWAGRTTIPFLCCEITFAPEIADAGHARRFALDLGAGVSAVNGVLLTTDADSAVAPDWARLLVEEVKEGAGLAYGSIDSEPQEFDRLPKAVREMEYVERALFDQQAGLWALVVPGEPQAFGQRAGGASMAISAGAYREVGGLPALRRDEDRAMVSAMVADGRTVAFARNARTTTSCRLVSPASGGMAETLMRRIAGDRRCDHALLPVRDFVLRALAWRILREDNGSRESARVVVRLAAALSLPTWRLSADHDAVPHGQRWSAVMATLRAVPALALREAQGELETARRLSSALRERLSRGGLGGLPVVAILDILEALDG